MKIKFVFCSKTKSNVIQVFFVEEFLNQILFSYIIKQLYVYILYFAFKFEEQKKTPVHLSRRKKFWQFSLMVFSRKSLEVSSVRFYFLIFHINRSSSECSVVEMVYTLLIYSFIFTFISQIAFNTIKTNA